MCPDLEHSNVRLNVLFRVRDFAGLEFDQVDRDHDRDHVLLGVVVVVGVGVAGARMNEKEWFQLTLSAFRIFS